MFRRASSTICVALTGVAILHASCGSAGACDRMHYQRPPMRASRTTTPPTGLNQSGNSTAAELSESGPSGGTGAMKAYVDPRTGRLTDRPVVPENPPPPTRKATPSAPEPAPGGGTKVKLGREDFPH